MRERVLSTLSGFFAALGLLLAAIGLYGVMAYTIARRTSEIAIRIALGATRTRIARSVVKEAMIVVVTGFAVGIIAALWLARPLSALLFGLEPNDLSTIAAVGVVMILTGGLAAYLPSRRAARIDPVTALRME